MMKLSEDKILQELPIAYGIEQMKEHRRISILHKQGTKCTICGNEGKRFILHDINHWDVFDENLNLMVTSKTDAMPYCEHCLNGKQNNDKIRRELLFDAYRETYKPNFDSTPKVGDLVCKKAFAYLLWKNKKVKKSPTFNSDVYIDTVASIEVNPNTNENAAILLSSIKENSMYSLNGLVVLTYI